MKLIVILGAGMAGEPLEALGGKTPLEYADIPVMDDLASKGEMGTVGSLPPDLKPGPTDMDWEARADAAVRTLLEDGRDCACVCVEVPDEKDCRDSMERKIRAIECLDSRVIARVRDALDASGEEYRMLILTDRPVPGPVPYILYDSTRQLRRLARYSEAEAADTGIFEPNGCRLMSRFKER